MNDYESITVAIFVLIAIGLIWLSVRLLKLTQEGRLSRAIAKRARARSLRGHQAEKEAQTELEKLGFKVIERHVETNMGWWIDEEWHETIIKADYLVERDGQQAIVEVKTGNESRATHRHTRRQLLEYRISFPVDAVYLYDAERKTLSEVDFEPMLKPQKSANLGGFRLIIASFVGFFVGYYLSH